MKSQKEMSREERSLLLFFETCCVDQWGRINTQRMNKDDFDIAERWNKEKFIEFGRLPGRYVIDPERNRSKMSMYVKLSADAYLLAHEERLARASRNIHHLDNILAEYC